MQHIAILTGSILDRILSGEKTVETRWYRSKKAPFESIAPGDTIYLKRSGGRVVARCAVKRALFFGDLDHGKIRELIRRYGKEACMSERAAENLEGKRYCSLIWLSDVTRLDAPFGIDKKGFGNMCAWIRIDDVERIRK